jgi:DNA-binding Lrp family transcriptional regulator
MADLTINQLMDELAAGVPGAYDPKKHITIAAFAERTGLSHNSALNRLRKLEREGKLIAVVNGVRRDDGYTVDAWTRAGE